MMKAIGRLGLRHLVILLVAAAPAAVRASAAGQDCMAGHMSEAIALNSRRMPVYAKQDWRARFVSLRLITGEVFGRRFVARGVDELARPFQKAGVAIVCDEFISMTQTPALAAMPVDSAPLLSDFHRVDTPSLARRLEAIADGGNFEKFAAAVEARLHDLSAEPRFNCMTRHTLESVLRAANLAPRHDAKARSLGLPPTRAVSWKLIRVQLNALKWTGSLDAAAAVVQAKGIPMICQDVPAIPPH